MGVWVYSGSIDIVMFGGCLAQALIYCQILEYNRCEHLHHQCAGCLQNLVLGLEISSVPNQGPKLYFTNH